MNAAERPQRGTACPWHAQGERLLAEDCLNPDEREARIRAHAARVERECPDLGTHCRGEIRTFLFSRGPYAGLWGWRVAGEGDGSHRGPYRSRIEAELAGQAWLDQQRRQAG